MSTFSKTLISAFVIFLITETAAFSIRSTIGNQKRSSASQNLHEEITKEADEEKNSKEAEPTLQESSDDSNAYPNYSFAYEVRDPTTGDDKQHEEKRDGDLVQGQYSLIEPDGSRRIVAYISNGTDGFRAFVLKINASELTVPIEEDRTTTEITHQQPNDIATTTPEIDECEAESSSSQLEGSHTDLLETQIPNESKTYMNLENRGDELIQYRSESEEEIPLSSEEDKPERGPNQFMVKNFENETQNSSELEQEKVIKTNGSNQQMNPNYISTQQSHIIAYPMTVVHTHLIAPMPLLVHFTPNIAASSAQNQNESQEKAPLEIYNKNYDIVNLKSPGNMKNKSNVQSDDDRNQKTSGKHQQQNISKKSKKSRRQSVQNVNESGKTIKLRVSYKPNQNDNRNVYLQVLNEKLNRINNKSTRQAEELQGY